MSTRIHEVVEGACESGVLMMGSELFIKALPARAPSVSHTLASSLPEGAYTPTTEWGQSRIPQYCAFVCGRFVNRPYDRPTIEYKQKGFPQMENLFSFL